MTTKKQVAEAINNLFTETGYNTLMTMILTDPNQVVKIYEYARRIEQRELKLIDDYVDTITEIVSK